MIKAAAEPSRRLRVLTEADVSAVAGGTAALNNASQSTGAGAGRVTFNPFSITRKIDRSSP